MLGSCLPNVILVDNKSILGFKTNEIYENELNYIEISGLIGHSSYNYKNVDIGIENENIVILMYGELSNKNKSGSGSFNVLIPIEKTVNKILFGNEREIIWERKTIETLEKREELLNLLKYTPYNEIIEIFGEPDEVIGSGFLIIQYTLKNNRKAVLNFGGSRDGLLKLVEIYGIMKI
jgi:hypothetical protein